MRRIIVFGLMLISGLLFEARGQAVSTNVLRIEVDGKTVKKHYKVRFLHDGLWIESQRTTTGFVVPSEVKGNEWLTLSISFGKHDLLFSEIHISKFARDWVVGVDKKPFSKEFVKPEDAPITTRAYYIHFKGGEPETRLIVTNSIKQ